MSDTDAAAKGVGGGAAPFDDLVLLVAMATYRRPDCLDRVLPLLVSQLPTIAMTAGVLVVDNDPSGSAAAQVGDWAASGVRYVHEPTPGIASARNRALDCAADADLLVFIDDDEIPAPDWLSALVSTWLDFRCAAVAGPVVPEFEAEVEPWVLATEVFDRMRMPTGTEIRGAATNNLLLDLRVLRSLDLRFDERFGTSGGSDTMLTHTLKAAGGVIRWCDEAEVVDIIPAARTTRAWTMRRTIRTSNTWTRVRMNLTTGRLRRGGRRVELGARGAKRGLLGAAGWSWGTVTGNVGRQARGARDMASAWGVFMGVGGFTWFEYQRPPSKTEPAAR